MKYKPIAYRDFLTEARIHAKKTQEEIADALGISRSSWQKYEYGQRKPRRKYRYAIKQLLGIPLDAWGEDRDCA